VAVFAVLERDRQISKIANKKEAEESCDRTACADVLAEVGDPSFRVPKLFWFVVVRQVGSQGKQSLKSSSFKSLKASCLCLQGYYLLI
jgi:hypothetical protein